MIKLGPQVLVFYEVYIVLEKPLVEELTYSFPRDGIFLWLDPRGTIVSFDQLVA